ncbi:Dabb family protein [Demequina sp. SO4-18]|uniref:Dabb family protein n=1 Tax=Demequina sp. SO4-18 TaxID=3401026 RepID=UPI003B5CF628
MTPSGGIVHVVLTQWRSDTPSEALAELPEMIERFPAEIPGVVSVVHGESVSPEGLEAGYDWGLVVTFDRADGLDGYLPHPTHLPVAGVIGEWAERLVVFDLSA